MRLMIFALGVLLLVGFASAAIPGDCDPAMRMVAYWQMEGNAEDSFGNHDGVSSSWPGGTSGLAVGIGDLTMSCANQFYHFNKTAQNKFRHSASIADKVKMLPRVIAGSLATSLEVVKLYKAFESTKVSRGLADQLVNALVGVDKSMTVAEMNDVTPSGKVSTRKLNIMEDIYRNIETEMNSKGNSLWGLHSGITRYTTHDMTPSRTGNARLDLVTNVNGAGYKFNQTSLEFAKMVMA